ncbi:hypothetical protein JOM56_014931 [Amanita muscaria]
MAMIIISMMVRSGIFSQSSTRKPKKNRPKRKAATKGCSVKGCYTNANATKNVVARGNNIRVSMRLIHLDIVVVVVVIILFFTLTIQVQIHIRASFSLGPRIKLLSLSFGSSVKFANVTSASVNNVVSSTSSSISRSGLFLLFLLLPFSTGTLKEFDR